MGELAGRLEHMMRNEAPIAITRLEGCDVRLPVKLAHRAQPASCPLESVPIVRGWCLQRQCGECPAKPSALVAD